MPDEQPSGGASLNACILMCDSCRKLTTVPLSKLQFEIDGDKIIIKFVCDRCHAQRRVALKRGVDF